MNSTIKSGILIGVLCGVWMLIMGYTSWYKNPTMYNVFFVVILLQIGVMVWGLKQTAADKAYAGQVIEGTLMSVYGGVILFVLSLVFTGVLFPHYFEEIQNMYAQIMRSQGKTEQEIADAVQAAMKTQTTFLQALFGLLGTVATGVVASLIIAIIYRKKSDAVAIQ